MILRRHAWAVPELHLIAARRVIERAFCAVCPWAEVSRHRRIVESMFLLRVLRDRASPDY